MIGGAEHVYAGQIVDGGTGRILVNVTEVWKGGPIEEQVWLEVELEGWTSWATLGREIPEGYASPKTWVFAPQGAVVGPCSAWQMDHDMSQYLLPHRPDQPQEPVSENARHDGGESSPPLEKSESSIRPLAGGVGGATLLVALFLVVTLRRRRSLAQPR